MLRTGTPSLFSYFKGVDNGLSSIWLPGALAESNLLPNHHYDLGENRLPQLTGAKFEPAAFSNSRALHLRLSWSVITIIIEKPMIKLVPIRKCGY